MWKTCAPYTRMTQIVVEECGVVPAIYCIQLWLQVKQHFLLALPTLIRIYPCSEVGFNKSASLFCWRTWGPLEAFFCFNCKVRIRSLDACVKTCLARVFLRYQMPDAWDIVTWNINIPYMEHLSMVGNTWQHFTHDGFSLASNQLAVLASLQLRAN